MKLYLGAHSCVKTCVDKSRCSYIIIVAPINYNKNVYLRFHSFSTNDHKLRVAKCVTVIITICHDKNIR